MRSLLRFVLLCVKRLAGMLEYLLFRMDRPNFFVNCAKTAKINRRAIHGAESAVLYVGEMSIVAGGIYFEREGATVSIGKNTFVGGSSLYCATKITIGNDVLISFGATIADHDSHSLFFSERKNDVALWYHGEKDWSSVKTEPVTISDKAWIGMHCIILKGVTIGEGAVVGAGSVVTKDVPPYTLVAGNPARVIRKLEPERYAGA